jgi:sugar (pentulose or hexulose) kinase
MHDLVGVFDVGKTHTKLTLIAAASGEVVQAVRRVNQPRHALGFDQLDIAGIEHWLLEALRRLPQRARVTALVPVAHGAACVLVDAAGQVLAAPDYEDPCCDEAAAAYGRERDPFVQTLSPRLPNGQNLGAQFHFLQTCRPQLWGRVSAVLLLPQFWAWRLCGVAASEISSLGAHTDLWRPEHGTYSALALRRGWHALLPPLRPAGEVLGPLAPAIVAATGLRPTCAVLCGVHDSNASWLSHLHRVQAGASLTVVSSGTWTIAMKSRADLSRLREDRDMLANVDIHGHPVATARFMGGREYAAIAGAGADAATPALDDLRRVVALGAMALPAYADAGGPFQGRAGFTRGGDGLSAGERAALASVYVALVIEVMLDLLGESDTVVIDGPLATNPLVPGLLAMLLPGSTLVASTPASGAGAGAGAGALVLALGAAMPPPALPERPVEPLPLAGFSAYRSAWRALCMRDR